MQLQHHLKRAANGSVLETTAGYRTAIGVLGAALPAIMIVGTLSGLLANKEFERSISAYYHSELGDFFVGILWVIGVFLFFYKYRPGQHAPRSNVHAIQQGHADAWLGKFTGIAAVLVAICPTDHKDTETLLGAVHVGAAVVLFICLSLFPLMLFSESRRWRLAYQLIGWSMIGVLALILGWWLVDKDSAPLLGLETTLILLFSAGWFLKGEDQRRP
jgi:hypothetical protein